MDVLSFQRKQNLKEISAVLDEESSQARALRAKADYGLVGWLSLTADEMTVDIVEVD
jgi:hypothetical protein